MTGFVLATAEELVAKDWGMVIGCKGIDLEAGSTLTIAVSYLPSRKFEIHQFDLAAVKKLTSNELIIQQMIKDSRPRLNRSTLEVQFLSIDFVLRIGNGIATWLLCRDVLSIVGAVAEFREAHSDADLPDAEDIIRAVLAALHNLNCWLNINKSIFKKVNIAMSTDDARQIGLQYHESEEGWAVIGEKGVM